MIPADPPFDIAGEIGRERGRLLTVLRSLDDEDWSLPTRCPGWSILDLAAHLIGDDLGYIAGHRDAHHGTEPPPGLGAERFITWLDELQDDWVRAARRLSPRLTIELLAWLDDRMVETIRADDSRAEDATVSWASDGLVPRWLDHGRELTERWIHHQQIADALGRPTEATGETLARVLDILRWAYPPGLEDIAAPEGAGVVIAVDGWGLSMVWTLVCSTAGWSFDPVDDAQVIARMTMTPEQAWRQLTNNLEPSIHGRPVLEGDPDACEALLRTRAIIGHPK
jgi:uncharacterized protein (TIGR03083 family)